MKTFGRALLLAAVLALPSAALASGRPTRPVLAITRVLIVSVDGLRSDVLLRADAPTLHRIMSGGAFTMWAKTTAAAVTLPSHVSMLTGVTPRKHGIDWNTALPLSRQIYPAWPTLFELAHGAGLSTAMAAGKSKFATLAKPGSLTFSLVPTRATSTDEEVTDKVIQWIDRSAPQVLFVHLPSVDTAGHAHGWGSSEQLGAIASTDRCMGRLLNALGRRGVLDSTAVLITSDHGGAARTHGPDDSRSREIPWIVSGPGICRGLDLTSVADRDIRIEDTFATVCWLLGIPAEKAIDGHAVTEIICPESR